MFEDQDAARTEQSAFQDQLHDLLAALQVVGGVGEDHVELLGAAFQVEENVGLDRVEVFDPQQCGRPADEIVMHGVDLDRRDAPCAARGEFVADRPRAGKEVEHVALLEIEQVAQYVEEVLLGEVGRGPRTQVFGRVDRPAPVFSADYSHVVCLNRLPSSLRAAFGLSPAMRSSYSFNGKQPSSRSKK